MKRQFFRTMMFGAAITAALLTGCKKESINTNETKDADRWLTLSGALDDPADVTVGDGNAGTMVFSLTAEDAKKPTVSVNIFSQGMHVKSQRTARLQASADGKFLYNIQYTGADGGIFNKYSVKGGNNFVPEGSEVETATYVSSSPRWLKATEGVGVAVRATANAVVYKGTSPDFVFKQRTAKTDILTLDLNDPKITKTTSFDLALSAEEVAAGYYISRIDVPIVNKAGNKLYIGAAISKINTSTFTIGTDGKPIFPTDNVSQKTWAKTLVLDYPSLANPKLLTTNQTRANTNGYRSTMQYIGTDGNIYQATSGEGTGKGGSKILRISAATNEYDNSYVFSLDKALGLTDTYIETWKYAGDGIAFVVYSLGASRSGGYIARVNLNTKTATKYSLPNEANLYFGQIQNLAINGDDIFVAIAPVGADGNIYCFNSKTGAMTVGAKLINLPGNQYIGVY